MYFIGQKSKIVNEKLLHSLYYALKFPRNTHAICALESAYRAALKRNNPFPVYS